MIGIGWTFCWLPLTAFGPQTTDARQCFELVKQFDSPKAVDRERLRKELTDRPAAIWAVVWGSQQQKLEIRVPCLDILDDWNWQVRLGTMVARAGGDFDRFLNSFLAPTSGEPDLFAKASVDARTLDRYFVKKSLARSPKGFPSLSVNALGSATPFHDFSAYLQWKPSPFEGFLRLPAGQSPPLLAKCTGIKTAHLSCSMAFSAGNVDLTDTSRSVLICGADANFVGTISSSLIVAAGDVKLSRSVVQAFVIAGGQITIDDYTHTHNVVLVSPLRIQTPVLNKRQPRPLVFDGKPKPTSELFAFRDLWTDYGLQATLDHGRVRIIKVNDVGRFVKFFEADDVVVTHHKTKLESIAQFRRLLGHSEDVGRMEFEVERGGKQLKLEAPLRRADSAP